MSGWETYRASVKSERERERGEGQRPGLVLFPAVPLAKPVCFSLQLKCLGGVRQSVM